MEKGNPNIPEGYRVYDCTIVGWGSLIEITKELESKVISGEIEAFSMHRDAEVNGTEKGMFDTYTFYVKDLVN